MHVLVVEDDAPLMKAIVTVFEDEGYQAEGAVDGSEGLFMAEQGIYDLIVLDMMLPEVTGMDVIKRLRGQNVKTPILILTAQDSVQDRVRGLDSGADEYMVKPFASQELLARVRALMRRQSGASANDGHLSYLDLHIRAEMKDADINGCALQLTVKEYELLEFFVRHSRQILTREQIFDRIWGFDSDASLGVVDLYVHYLRKKLAAHACDHWLQTIRGAGYMLKEKPICSKQPKSD
jgi:two-component system response regulator CiaR